MNKRIKSDSGLSIELLDISPAVYNNIILVIGVMHGDEPDGEYLINRYLEEIDTEKIKNRLLFIPCLNPDGKKYNKRTNSNDVDLNRNYPSANWEGGERNEYYGGNKAGSETETQFVMKIFEELRPDCILALHSPYRVVNYDGPAKKIAQKISEITGYPVQSNIGYPTPGSFGTYWGIERNIPVITLELPENQPKEELWAENKGVFEYFAMDF